MVGRLQEKVALVVGAGSIGPGWGNGKAAKTVERWPMTSLREKLIKIGAKVVSDAGAGGARSRAISDRISANSRRGTATSTS